MKRDLFLEKLFCIAVVWSTATVVNAQNNGTYTFHWGAEDFGLVFESTNLSVGVKASIAHDIEQGFYRIPVEGSSFLPLPATHPDFGKYTGTLFVTNFFAYWPDIFVKQFGKYQLQNGTNNFIITDTLGTCYQNKISLTNSHAIASTSFSNFFASVSGLTTNTASIILFKQLWWSLLNDSASAWGADNEELVLEELKELTSHNFYYPSVLEFSGEWRDRSEFICVVRLIKETTCEITRLGFIFKNGQWYLVAFDGT
jgi:hypothetical protein